MELEKLTALQLADKIKKHEVSVLDGVKEVFSKIEEKDGRIHAYLDTYKKEAYARAKEVEKGIEDGTYTSPLAGVPIAIKDNICVQGKPTTCASKILEGFVPQYQADVISRLEKAGMIIIGKTNMDEFAMGSTTETSAYGITRNPWNTEHVPGGSSGGSCAAVAAGEAYLSSHWKNPGLFCQWKYCLSDHGQQSLPEVLRNLPHLFQSVRSDPEKRHMQPAHNGKPYHK